MENAVTELRNKLVKIAKLLFDANKRLIVGKYGLNVSKEAKHKATIEDGMDRDCHPRKQIIRSIKTKQTMKPVMKRIRHDKHQEVIYLMKLIQNYKQSATKLPR